MIKVHGLYILNDLSIYWKLLTLYYVDGAVLGGGCLAVGANISPSP